MFLEIIKATIFVAIVYLVGLLFVYYVNDGSITKQTKQTITINKKEYKLNEEDCFMYKNIKDEMDTKIFCKEEIIK